MTKVNRIFGMELSPFSIKVRSYFRYKRIPHQWIVRNANSTAEYAKYAKLQIVPLVVTPEGEGVQDSTPIIERFEAAHPEPSILPPDPAARFAAIVLEEFGDEWGNKWMFHLRWAREVDQISTSRRLAYGMMTAAAKPEMAEQMATQLRNRMVPRVSFVGSNPVTAPLIEKSFREGLALLDAHFQNRPYLFGGRPSFADFALWGQLYNAWLDPTGFAWITAHSTALQDWVHRMINPMDEGEFEAWSSLSETLAPLMADQVGALFLPWTAANTAAMGAGEEEFTVELKGDEWTQKAGKYQVKSFRALRDKYAALEERAAVDEMLRSTGCLEYLQA